MAENATRQGAADGVNTGEIANSEGEKTPRARHKRGGLVGGRKLTLILPPKLYAAADKAARTEESSLTQWIRTAIRGRLDSSERAERARKSARGGK